MFYKELLFVPKKYCFTYSCKPLTDLELVLRGCLRSLIDYINALLCEARTIRFADSPRKASRNSERVRPPTTLRRLDERSSGSKSLQDFALQTELCSVHIEDVGATMLLVGSTYVLRVLGESGSL